MSKAKKIEPPGRITDYAVSLVSGSKRKTDADPFRFPDFPKNAMPRKPRRLASDESLSSFGVWAYGQLAGAAMEGQTFLGYAYLSELSQRPEYRRMVEQLAFHMTRRWIKLRSKGGNKKKADKLKQLEAALKRHLVREMMKEVIEQDGFFGRSHLFVDLKGSRDRPRELEKPIGDGGESSAPKVGKGQLLGFKTVEPIWVYPQSYNTTDPLDPDWYRPQTWYVMGKPVHRTRLLTFIAREVPDLLKPAYAFGGMPLTQMAKPYVDNWLDTRSAVTNLVKSFSQFVLSTDLLANLASADAAQQLALRLDAFNRTRSNRGIMAIDKTREEFKNVSASIAGLHEIQAQAQEQQAFVSGIPLVFLLGDQAGGLNASDEGAIHAFYAWIKAMQEFLLGPKVDSILGFVQLSEFGAIDDDITYEWVNLWSPTEKEAGEMRKADADRDDKYITAGVLHPEQVYDKLKDDPDSGYTLDGPWQPPEIAEEEEPIPGAPGE